jgi:arsenate reductase
MITIYHNPRCSKSRAALAIAQEFSVQERHPLEVVDYIETPLSMEQLTSLHRQLGIALREMVRDTEAEYEVLCLAQADDAALLQALVNHPKLLQRPIVTYEGKAVIGRPPERLNDLFRGA